MPAMRRLYAILLLCLFGLMPAAPLLALTAPAEVAVCCRVGGMHHCMAAIVAGSPALRAPCPMQHPEAAAPVHAPVADAPVETAPGGPGCLRAPPVAHALQAAAAAMGAPGSRGPPAGTRG